MFFTRKPVVIAAAVVICLVCVTAAFYAYFSLSARRIFNAQISSLTQRRVEARVVRAEFPASLVIEGLSVEGLLTCERVRASVDITSLLGRDVRIRALELIGPVLIWEKVPSASSPDIIPAPRSAQAVSNRNLILSELLVHDGALKVVMKDQAGGSREYVVDGIQLRARNVPLTDTPAGTEFFLTASLVNIDMPFVGNFVKASGWLNWAAKDMDAAVQVMDDSGRVGVDAKFASRQNDMTVFGNMTIAGSQEAQAIGKKTGMLENAVLGMMMATDTDIELGFSFKTKMDDMDIGAVKLSGHVTTGLNSSVTSGNIVAGLKAAGEELLKAAGEQE